MGLKKEVPLLLKKDVGDEGLPWWLRWQRICLQCRRPRVHSLGWEDPLEKEMATHFSFLAWEILRTEEPGRLQSIGSQRVGHD